MPVREHDAGAPRWQGVVGWAVGVAVNQRVRLGVREPLIGKRRIGIGVLHARLLALFAFAAQMLGQGAALGQGAGQQLLLPGRLAADGAKLLVFSIVQAQRIAVRKQDALRPPDQQGGVGQAVHAAGPQKRCAGQKVAVAHHEIDGPPLAGRVQRGGALGFKAARLLQGIVAHPGFKQIAQDHDGAGRAAL